MRTYTTRLGNRSLARGLRLCSLLALLATGLEAQSPPWYNSSWSYRQPITISHTKVGGSTTLTNFPVLISIASDSNLTAALTTGYDILFTDSSGTSKLNHEIETFVHSTGQLVAWVQVPSVSTTADTVIYMYYGNSSASNQQNAAAVWDTDYKAVWHLGNGTTLATADSTSHGHSVTPQGSTNAGSGEVSGGMAFHGGGSANNAYAAASTDWDFGTGDFTLSGWQRIDPANDYGWDTVMGRYDGSKVLVLFSNVGGDHVAHFCTISYCIAGTSNVTDNSFHYIVATRASGVISIYADGALQATSTDGSDSVTMAAGTTLGIGMRTDNWGWMAGGGLDELHVSNAARSAGWITTEFNSQSSPTTFFSVGTQQTNSGSTVTITLTSSPAVLSLSADGTGCTSPCTFQWTPGANHTIAVTTSPQSGGAGIQYAYASWSDSGAQSHQITTPSSATTYTATFNTQYYLTTVATTGGSISPSSEWANSGTGVSVSASANNGYFFNGFSGALVGTTSPQNLTMTAPFTVTANFSTTGGGGSTFVTTYSYDLTNNLTKVTMIRPTGTQIRTFNYNNTPYLQSATNPETGTVYYTYNQYNKVATKTDAKGQAVVYTYDTYARLTKVQRYPQGTGNAEDTCQQENYYYDTNPFDSNYSQYTSGRLTAVQYYGGSTLYGRVNGGNNCDTTFTEMYSYSAPGAKAAKRLRVYRPALPWYNEPAVGQQTTGSAQADLNSTYTYDNEGRMITTQYPGYSTGGQTAGPNLGWAFDTMGRLNTMTDLATSTSIVSGSTYGPSNELLTMTGQYSETRTYNAMLQVATVATGSVNMTYTYSASHNNGKIISQTDNVSGEQVQYAYDALNRLASAEATSGSWGQSYAYDGFGNLTDQNVIAGTAPTYHVVPDPTTNHIGTVDGNGNSLVLSGYNIGYDVENRFTGPGTYFGYSGGYQYSYAPGNKRVWRGNYGVNGSSPILTTDEVTFWSVSGQRLASYNVNVVGGNGPGTPPSIVFQLNVANYYFGGKMIGHYTSNFGLAVTSSDRLGSIGKYYPYGQEKGTGNPASGEKFTGYFRDSETQFDYADQRYHNPGTGRFLTADASARGFDPRNAGTWNRYAYVLGDPVNHSDPGGTDCTTYAKYGSDGDLVTFEDWGCQSAGYIGPAATGYGGNDFLSNMTALIANALGSIQVTIPTFTQSGQAGALGTWSAGMTNAVNALDSVETAKLSSSQCQKDLTAIGISGSQLNSAAYKLWGPVDGTTSNSLVSSVSLQPPDFTGETVAQLFAANPGVSALAGNLINVVYIDPTQWATYSAAEAFGTMIHELIHVTTSQSDQIMWGELFGPNIPYTGNSSLISTKFANDCVQK